MKYYQVFISAEDEEQAKTILGALLAKKLVFGGPVFGGPAQFWWKGNIEKMNYSFIFTYTREDLRDEMIKVAEEASAEEVCMISMTELEANSALLKLLDETFDS